MFFSLTRFFSGISAALGALAVAVIVITAFVIAILIRIGVKGLGARLVRRRIYVEAGRFGEEIKRGAEKLKQAAIM
jgi:hypothetical protein